MWTCPAYADICIGGASPHQADAAVTVLVVVPAEKALAMRAGVLDRVEALGELGSILQRLELRLRVRIVVRDILLRRTLIRNHYPTLLQGETGRVVAH
jgi:hypothetical protein